MAKRKLIRDLEAQIRYLETIVNLAETVVQPVYPGGEATRGALRFCVQLYRDVQAGKYKAKDVWPTPEWIVKLNKARSQNRRLSKMRDVSRSGLASEMHPKAGFEKQRTHNLQ